MLVFPDYYTDFRCIADKCRHNCCIGWEIDIDEDTAAYYKTVPGALGRRLAANIAEDGVPHFILGEQERCPFLNRGNLCDIILELGEAHLCDICRLHPRFTNELPGRTETGIGMACEEAARLILTKKTPMCLVGDTDTEDEIILLRDNLIQILQNREITMDKRIFEMLARANATFEDKSLAEWKEVFMKLERLDETWTETLSMLDSATDFDGFAAHMRDRMYEYEQLAVYFVYRYFANAPDLEEAARRAAFAALCVKILFSLGEAMFTKHGDFTVADQIELCRLFSSEVEYSDENLYCLLDEIL